MPYRARQMAIGGFYIGNWWDALQGKADGNQGFRLKLAEIVYWERGKADGCLVPDIL